MSRLLQVTEMVPLSVVQAVGPAPKAGRPRWLALGELLRKDAAGVADAEMGSAEFAEAESDMRFQRLFSSLEAARRTKRGRPKRVAQEIESEDGKVIASVIKSGKVTRLTIPESAGKDFVKYLVSRLPDLHADYEDEYGE